MREDDLFSQTPNQNQEHHQNMKDNSSEIQRNSDAPLAHQLRPRTIKEFYGQEKIIKEILVFQNSNNKMLPHFIFWGPPGSGKTSLALLLSDMFNLKLYQFNAVMDGVPALRKLIDKMKNDEQESGKRPLLFIDEIHRFNKAQQDALLPYLELSEFQFSYYGVS